MRKPILLVLVLALVAPLAASAQPRLPDDVLRVLAEECASRPGPMPDDRAFGDLLNAVAWRTQDLGMGLSRKAGGKHVDSPVGPVAEDILCDRSTGHHWDVLVGADVGLPLRCPQRRPDGQWDSPTSIGVMRDPNRPCIAPVAPASAPGGGPGEPVTPAPTQPAPSPTPAPDYRAEIAALTAAVAALRSDVAVLRAEAAGIRSEAGNAHESLYRLIAETVIAEHVASLYQRLDALQQQIANQPRPGTIRLPWEEE
jgi:hypothetical protein